MVGVNIELPAPEVIYDPTPDTPPSTELLTFDVTISNTLFTGWIVRAIIIVVAFLLTRGIRVKPTGRQNAIEYVYEGLANFATSLGGPQARKYVPVFAALFLFILLSNWSGLVPPVGRVHLLRAPTSDVNITFGLALVSFFMFHIEGVRALGVGGYLGKFFSLRAFRDEGVSAGIIALFVGMIEFFLEFIKPVTLAMRLFGNIYGGEVALGVIIALDRRDHSGRNARARGPAELHAGTDLFGPDIDVHYHRHRASRQPRGARRGSRGKHRAAAPGETAGAH